MAPRDGHLVKRELRGRIQTGGQRGGRGHGGSRGDRRGAELVSAAAEVVSGADLVVTAVSPRCLLAPSARARCSASRARANSCSAVVRQSTPQPPSDSQHPVGRAACLLSDGAYSHLRTAADAPLGHVGLPFDSFPPPRHHAHSVNARAFLLVDWYRASAPGGVFTTEVSSTENLAADGPLAHHLDASARRAPHFRQRRMIRPPPGHASRKHLHPTLHR